ncbi:cysteine--tRNA ligase [Rhizohabitans arisaemae]|uniref:cysteine--tRNA ligase n=1 Tax=Rhizohabitans arisaemae TaxID=2720610 RepID=UPI0024B199FB|nr:cysteine--tRNA ligase [Rhizohabitans arisaemae]
MLRLHDSRTDRIEPVAASGFLRVYTCGPAAGRPAGLGDLRPYLLADLIRRVAECRGRRVLTCRNRAEGEVTGAEEDVRSHLAAFDADTLALNIHPPGCPAAGLGSVDLVVDLIAALVERGHAYIVQDGSVFFSAESFPGYGAMSGGRVHGGREDDRIEVGDPRKRGHADWVLWEPRSTGPCHLAPWGRGLPGAHVECSALPLDHLGTRIDVHVGDASLSFPHHENVRAQSNAATGRETVGHWAHTAPVSPPEPSAGLRRVVDAGLDPLAVRLALLERHHRHPADLTWDVLRAAGAGLDDWRSRVAAWAESPSAPLPAEPVAAVVEALENDLDTPRALRLLDGLGRDRGIAPGARFEAFIHLDRILGLDLALQVGRAAPG